MPRIAIPVRISNLKHGVEESVIFYADTPDRAWLLHAIVQTMARGERAGEPLVCSSTRMDHIRVREALPPTTVHDHEQQEQRR